MFNGFPLCLGRGRSPFVPQVRQRRGRAARGPPQLLLRRAGPAPGTRACQDTAGRLRYLQVSKHHFTSQINNRLYNKNKDRF